MQNACKQRYFADTKRGPGSVFRPFYCNRATRAKESGRISFEEAAGGSHPAIYTRGITAKEADDELKGALRELKLIPETSETVMKDERPQGGPKVQQPGPFYTLEAPEFPRAL